VLLRAHEQYEALGLSGTAVERLSRFGDLLISCPFNVTSLSEPWAIEQQHFLDALSLLGIAAVREARDLVDVGSGGGLPALVLAIALPETLVVALESVNKKCDFIRRAAATLGLENAEVECARAEDYGRGRGRERFDVAVARAVAGLPVLAELCLPLVRVGGTLVAMKGAISNQECMEGEKAIAILGGEEASVVPVEPFSGAENRCLVVARKRTRTPGSFPRRAGVPERKPLGMSGDQRGKSATL
jgi:16S rRNA (guanine527-N7)-methyltransferase